MSVQVWKQKLKTHVVELFVPSIDQPSISLPILGKVFAFLWLNEFGPYLLNGIVDNPVSVVSLISSVCRSAMTISLLASKWSHGCDVGWRYPHRTSSFSSRQKSRTLIIVSEERQVMACELPVKLGWTGTETSTERFETSAFSVSAGFWPKTLGINSMDNPATIRAGNFTFKGFSFCLKALRKSNIPTVLSMVHSRILELPKEAIEDATGRIIHRDSWALSSYPPSYQ